MTSHNRADRISNILLTELGSLMARTVRDPRIRHISLTKVKMPKDLSHATIFYGLMPHADVDKRDISKALYRARPFLRRHLARLDLRQVPEIKFLFDDAAEKQDRVAHLLDKIAVELSQNDKNS